MNKIYAILVGALSSRKLFWTIIAFFVFESSWIALSFAYPLVYDEAFHFPVIKIFSHQWLPIIFNQPHSADLYGNLTYGAGSFYHFIMSFPYRLIEIIFPDRFAVQVVLLRLLNVFMAALGLVLFDKLFRQIHIKQIHNNVALLLFILIPLVPFCAATISYDNMLFPLTAAYLILCVSVLRAKIVDWKILAWVIIVGSLTSLVKVAFLPIFAASIIYLIIFLIWKNKRNLGTGFLKSLKTSHKLTVIGLTLIVLIFVSLITVRYVWPTIQYGTPTPDCQQVMPSKRCLDYSSQIVMGKIKTKNTRAVKTFPDYATMWFTSSLETLGRAVAVGPGWGDYQKPLPIINTLLFFLIIGGVGILTYAWRSLDKNESWYFLLTMSVALLVVTFQFNYSLYLRLHYPFAIQPRYLLNFVPIIIVMIVVACSHILRQRRTIKLASLLLVTLLFLQGGGTATYILRGKDFWYWQNNEVLQANHIAKKVLAPLIKEQ